jgi:hypothetical protein
MLRPFTAPTQMAPPPAAPCLMTHSTAEARSRVEQKCYDPTWRWLCLQQWTTDEGRSTKLNTVHIHHKVIHLTMVSLKKGQMAKGRDKAKDAIIPYVQGLCASAAADQLICFLRLVHLVLNKPLQPWQLWHEKVLFDS